MNQYLIKHLVRLGTRIGGEWKDIKIVTDLDSALQIKFHGEDWIQVSSYETIYIIIKTC